MKRVGGHLRGNLIAYLALFCAIGLGTAYAVERNSIGTKEIANGAIRSADVRDDDQKNGGLDAGDLREESVGTEEQAEVPSARLIAPTACAAGGQVPAGGDVLVGFVEVDFQSEGVDPQPSNCEAANTSLKIETPGLYLLTANVVWDQAPGGQRSLQLWRADGEFPLIADTGSGPEGIPAQSVTDVQRLETGDEVFARVVQSADVPIALASQGALSAVWLGP